MIFEKEKSGEWVTISAVSSSGKRKMLKFIYQKREKRGFHSFLLRW